MAMRDTVSSPSDWVQFYRHNAAGQVMPPRQGTSNMFGRATSVAEATVVTTTTTTITPSNTGNSSTTSPNLNPEGRVSKPSRRRSRASRRAPTTLLNTDTTNFRAMVQQFTGVPSAPFSSGSQTSPPIFNFALGGRQHQTAMMVPPGYHHQQQHHQQQQQQQQMQQQQYMFSLNNHGDGYLPGFTNPTPNMEVSEGFLMESIPSHVFPRSSSNENRRSGYIL